MLAEPTDAGTVFDSGLPLGFVLDDIAPAAQPGASSKEEQEQQKRKKSPLQAFLEGAWSTLKGEAADGAENEQQTDDEN